MKLFLITFETHSQSRKTSIAEVLKAAKWWWHYIDSTWIIATKRSLEEWRAAVRGVITEEDSFLIIEVTNSERNGWLPQQAWQWIRDKNVLCREERGEKGPNTDG